VHVYLPHALLNAGALLIVGLQLERTIGAARLVLLFLVSGTAGQLVAVAAAPTVVATGASQAAIGMSVAAIIFASTMTGERSHVGLAAAACYLLIQACLDLLFAARIKTPHAMSFAVGALAATYWVWRRRRVTEPM
jgi:membrane associated rhomboid family serine protease